MIHVTIFGAHEGQLEPSKRFFLTLFGGCDLVRPTIARQLLAQLQAEQAGRVDGPRPFFLTLFGGVEIKSPTLVEEFIDLREMISGGLLSMEDWDRFTAGLGQRGGTIASFTMFGGFGENELPKEDEEVDGLAVQRHLGNIPEAAGQVLQYGIGRHGTERTATLRRAILATA